jgi:hypothetical protein
MPMELPDFPRWLRALFAVFLILFFFNALYALAFFTAIWHLRIDPGIAILMSVIVGLGIVAWQVRVGFTNLIRSQEHRASIEIEARQHQHTLDVEREDQIKRRQDEANKEKVKKAKRKKPTEVPHTNTPAEEDGVASRGLG